MPHPVKWPYAATGVGSWLPPMARKSDHATEFRKVVSFHEYAPTVHEALGRTCSQQVLGITPSRFPII